MAALIFLQEASPEMLAFLQDLRKVGSPHDMLTPCCATQPSDMVPCGCST
jgi:hypothetical protein